MAGKLDELWKVGASVPLAADLVEGGLGIDTVGKQAYSKAADGNIFPIGSQSGTAWGDITGTLGDQTDLQTELDTKVTNTDGIHTAITTLVSCTQAEYDAIATKGASTLYIILG